VEGMFSGNSRCLYIGNCRLFFLFYIFSYFYGIWPPFYLGWLVMLLRIGPSNVSTWVRK